MYLILYKKCLIIVLFLLIIGGRTTGAGHYFPATSCQGKSYPEYGMKNKLKQYFIEKIFENITISLIYFDCIDV